MAISKIGVVPLFDGMGSSDNKTHMFVTFGQHTTVAASDTVVTGLNTVVAVMASLDSDPVLTADRASGSIGDQAGAPAAGSILVETWMPTTVSDTTPIAATTFSKLVNWMAIGY